MKIGKKIKAEKFRKEIKYDEEVKDLDSLSESEAVKVALSNLPNLAEPKYELTEYLNKLSELSNTNDIFLQNYLTAYSSWQNYIGVQLKIAEVIQSVAESQTKYFYSLAIKNYIGKITERKEMAFNDDKYLASVEILNIAKAKVDSLANIFSACDRAYKTVSRIIAIREKLLSI